MEVVLADDDLGLVRGHALHLVAPLADHLDRRLDGLGAGVHRQRPLEAGDLAEPSEERAHLVVVEGPRGQRERVELPVGRLDDRRVPVTLVQRRVGAEHVEVAPSVDVPHPHPLPPLEHDRKRVVVVRAVPVDFREKALGLGSGRFGHVRLRECLFKAREC